MKIIISEKQKHLIESLILNEIRDESQYAAKENAVIKKLDTMFDYFPTAMENDPFGKMEWFIWTLNKGVPYLKVYKDTMFRKMQKEWQNLCDDPKRRDEMLKDIQDSWLKKKKEENKNKGR